jgi:hypothetical protein
MCLSSQLQQEVKNRRITIQASLGKKQDPISKLTRAERTEDVTQVVEYLPTKRKALSSNPVPPKNNNIILNHQAWWFTLVIPAPWEAEARGGQPGPYSENLSQKKWAGSVTQLVDCLRSKYKALSSNPSTEKKNTWSCNRKKYFLSIFQFSDYQRKKNLSTTASLAHLHTLFK